MCINLGVNQVDMQGWNRNTVSALGWRKLAVHELHEIFLGGVTQLSEVESSNVTGLWISEMDGYI